MEEEIITPEEVVFDYNKLRYILDKDGYVCHASLGGLIVCDLGECTEYNGEVPEGYETLVEWYDTQIEENKLNAWKIVDGNLVYDENKYNELQSLCKIQEEENTPATHKWVNDKIKVSNSVITDELASKVNGTSLIVLNDAGNYEIPELKVESNTINNVKVISSNKNILGIDFITTTINGVEVKNNGDGTITLNGTSTDAIELNLNGSNTNQEMIYLIKDNISYAISGLTNNVSLSLCSFDGIDRVYVGNYINQNITLSNSHKITQTTLNIPSGAIFEEAVINPQIEIGEATEFIKHEETSSIGMLESNECIVVGLMSYSDKTIIMIDEEVTSSVKYYTQQYLTKKFAEIEVTEQYVKTTVKEINETVEEQNTAISQISQTVNEIKSEISDIADITISADGYGEVLLDGINESEPIYIKICPSNNEDISYLYPNDNLFPSDDLFPKGRTLRFENGDYHIDYELPDDLLYYDENNYDEFILDYDTQTCEVNKKVAYNADGTKCLLEKPYTTKYEYPSLPLTTGDYKVTMLGCPNAYMFIRMMCENIYTNQFATKVELNSAIIQTKDSITSQVKAEYATKNDLVTAETKINQTTNEINLEVSKKVNNEDYTSANIIAKVNNDTSSIQIKASKIDLQGYLTITNASNTYATNSSLKVTNDNLKVTNDNLTNNYSSNEDLATSGKTIISGGNIKGDAIQSNNYVSGTSGTKINLVDGTIDTKYFKVSSTGLMNATGGTIGGWNISSSGLTKGSSYIYSNGRCSFQNNGWLNAGNNGYWLLGNGSNYKCLIGDDFSMGNSVSSYLTTSVISGVGTSVSSVSGNVGMAAINGSLILRTNDAIAMRGNNVNITGVNAMTIATLEGNINLRSVTGNVYIQGGIYSNSSSKNMKENIVEFNNDDEKELYDCYKNMKIYNYDYKEQYGNEKNQMGFILEQIDEKLYKLIDGTQNEEDENVKHYNPTKLTKVNTAMINILIKKIESLEEKLNVN